MSMQTLHILGNNIIKTLGILDGYKSKIGFPWYKCCKRHGVQCKWIHYYKMWV